MPASSGPSDASDSRLETTSFLFPLLFPVMFPESLSVTQSASMTLVNHTLLLSEKVRNGRSLICLGRIPLDEHRGCSSLTC